MDEEKKEVSEAPDVTKAVDEPVATEVPMELPSEPAPAPVEAPKKRRMGKKKLIIVITTVVVLAAAAAYFFLKKEPTKNNAADKSVQEITESKEETDKTELKPADITTASGLTIYGTPKKLDNLKFFKDYKYFGESCEQQNNCTNTVAESDVTYYEIGKQKDGKQILAVEIESHSMEDYGYIALESATSTYKILAKHGAGNEGSDFTKILAANVSLDATTVLADLQFPKEVTVAGQKLKTEFVNGYFLPKGLTSIRGSYFGDLKEGETTEKIENFGSFTLYRVVHKTTSNYKIVELYGTLGATFAMRYVPNGELASTSDKLPITWSSGESSAISAYSGGAGCGSAGYVIAMNVDAATLKQVGTSKAGQKIYQLPSTAALVSELYNEDYAKGANVEEPFKNLTLQQFLDKHAYFIVQNGLNEYVVFQRSDMFTRGGCGKPVVYLYPTTATSVSVKVGADVVVSVPHYETNGWQNVFAQPNGQLTYNGQSYDSLFWEGYGNGAYPEVTSGAVVKSSDAVSTIKAQLAAQGFNAKETADFLTYWQPKLPVTPYVRLTWFGTAAMNQLAPLTISPRPNTVIRTFLDFEGLQTPVNLPAQKFAAPKRNGFTVTEWGGLLREGIQR